MSSADKDGRVAQVLGDMVVCLGMALSEGIREQLDRLDAELAQAAREDAETSCEAGHPVQSCQGCDAGNCAMLPGFTPDEDECIDDTDLCEHGLRFGCEDC